jgi:putative sterol carrier protein
VLALRSLFDPRIADDLAVSYELRIGEERFRVEIADGKIELARGVASDPEASLAVPDAPTMAAVLTGQLRVDEALASGTLRLEGGKQAAKRFLRLFPMPEPCACEGSAAAEAVAGGGYGA